MSAAGTATPTPAAAGDDHPPVIAQSPSGDEGGDGSGPSPGISPSSTWKPNAEAAEWKPSFGADVPAPAAGGDGGEAEGLEAKGEGGKEGEVRAVCTRKNIGFVCFFGGFLCFSFCVFLFVFSLRTVVITQVFFDHFANFGRQKQQIPNLAVEKSAL